MAYKAPGATPPGKLGGTIAPEPQTIKPGPTPVRAPLATEIAQLLQYVAYGEQDQAETLVRKNRGLLFCSGAVTDYSGRKFNDITPFQLALWALDWHMWKMLLKYLTNDAARDQLRELEAKGTPYGKHYDFEPLLSAYKTYVNKCDDQKEGWGWTEQKKYWETIIDEAQTQVPAHVAQEYCHPDRSFYEPPNLDEAQKQVPAHVAQEYGPPNFIKDALPRSLHIIGVSSHQAWFPVASRRHGRNRDELEWLLSNDAPSKEDMPKDSIRNYILFEEDIPRGLCRGVGSRVFWARPYAVRLDAERDYLAVDKLCKIRTMQYKSLKEELLGASTPAVAASIPPETSTALPKLVSVAAAAPMLNQSQVNQLLQHVAYGEQDEAEALIKTNRDLLLCSGAVTDYSGRTFTNITPFQFALWALDWHMWKMLAEYLQQPAARDQLRELEAQGTPYGKHYDFNPLRSAYKTYVNNYDTWHATNRAHLETHWNTVIGIMQTRVPAHVAQEYCRPDRSFHTTPSFKEPSFPRSFKIGNDPNEVWFPGAAQSCGRWGCVGAVRGAGARVFRLEHGASAPGARRDFSAYDELCRIRTLQYEELKASLH